MSVDLVLVSRAQRGDKQAFGMLIDKYQRKIARLVSRMMRDKSEIEDVVQEVFIRAYRALAGFRGESAFYTWLYKIAVNTTKTYLIGMGKNLSQHLYIDEDEYTDMMENSDYIGDLGNT